jgi:carbamoyltransferase
LPPIRRHASWLVIAMNILGITAPISWNNAAVLVQDGTLIAAAEEERFIRVKHAPRFPPINAVRFCLKFAGIDFDEVDFIAVGFRHPTDYLFRNMVAEVLEYRWLTLHLQVGSAAEYYIQMSKLKTMFGHFYPEARKKKWIFIPHHIAHASSACRISGFPSANVISIDGSGEDDSGGTYIFQDNKLKLVRKIRTAESLGVLYSHTTDVIGFVRHSDEGKTMGLAPYGSPVVDLDDFFRLDGDWYKANHNWGVKFFQRFGPRRNGAQSISQFHKDLACSVQHRLEEIAVRVAETLHTQSQLPYVTLAGGVTLNCDMNAKLLSSGLFKDIFIQPAAHDAGTALGAAFEVHSRIAGKTNFVMEHAYWGPEYSDKEIKRTLQESKAEFEHHNAIESAVAKLLASGKIVGWFQGRMEWGPRALGNRSILAHPSLTGIKDKINAEVKHREEWRPFAPSILEEEAENYLESPHPSPFMLLTFVVRAEKRHELKAAMHIDNTVRVQTVSARTNPKYHKLIRAFQEITGIGALLNTSFNDREPIVMSPKDALRTYFSTGLDALAIGNFLLQKPDHKVIG